jgi:hypothetical protein
MKAAGKLLLNLVDLDPDDMARRAYEVEYLPDGATVELVVNSTVDPVVLDRLWTFGRHLRYIVTAADTKYIASWMHGIEDPPGPDQGADAGQDQGAGAGALRLVWP